MKTGQRAPGAPATPATPATLVRSARALTLLAFALALAWPALRTPTQRVLGSSHTDTVKHVWTLWMGRALLSGHGSLAAHTDLVNYPVGFNFFVIEPLGAVVATVLAPLPIVLVANLISLLNLVLLGFCTAWLGDQLAGGRLPGLVAGLLAMGSTCTAFFVHLGVGELQHIFFLPLTLMLSTRLAKTLRWRDALLLGLALGATVASGFYLGLFATVGVTVLSLGHLLRGPRRVRQAVLLGIAAVLSVAVAWPLVSAFRSTWPGGNPFPHSLAELARLRRPPVEDVWARLDLAGVLWPQPPDLSAPQPDYVGGGYLGPGLIILAGLGLVRRWRQAWPLALVAAAGFTLALGTRPVWLGREVLSTLWPHQVLPYSWLVWLLSTTGLSPHYPSRFIVLTVVALAGLSSLALVGLRRTSQQAAVLLLAAAALLDVGLRTDPGWPWPVAQKPPTAALAQLATIDAGAVVDLSYFNIRDQDARAATAWYQASHQLPTQAVAISQLDELHTEGAARVLALPLIADLRELQSQRTTPADAGETGLPDDACYQADLALLREDGFSWLMTYQAPHTDTQETPGPVVLPPQHQAAALRQLLGPPTVQEQGLAVWHIPQPVLPAHVLDERRRQRDAGVTGARAVVFERAR